LIDLTGSCRQRHLIRALNKYATGAKAPQRPARRCNESHQRSRSARSANARANLLKRVLFNAERGHPLRIPQRTHNEGPSKKSAGKGSTASAAQYAGTHAARRAQQQHTQPAYCYCIRQKALRVQPRNQHSNERRANSSVREHRTRRANQTQRTVTVVPVVCTAEITNEQIRA